MGVASEKNYGAFARWIIDVRAAGEA
jgi:hypothetical protein